MNLQMLTRPRPAAPVSPYPPPQARGPLPPFDPALVESGEPGSPPVLHPVYTEMWSPPLPSPNIRWWRGDAWGVTIPGLPVIYNAAGQATSSQGERALTWFLDQWSREWQDKILEGHAVRGYTHFSICPQESMRGPSQLSLSQYIDMAKRVKQACPYVHHLVRSKMYDDGHDITDMNAIIQALLDADVCQVHTPAWEMNYLSPDICRRMIDNDAAIVGTSAYVMLHFFPHYITWQPDGHPPEEFWEKNYGAVDGVLYQMDPHWSAGMMSARINDAQTRLCPGGMWGLGDSGRRDPKTGELHPIDIVSWEQIATCQFYDSNDGNGRKATEDQGNLKGFEVLCTPGPMPIMGVGNGGRWPDGRVL